MNEGIIFFSECGAASVSVGGGGYYRIIPDLIMLIGLIVSKAEMVSDQTKLFGSLAIATTRDS